MICSPRQKLALQRDQSLRHRHYSMTAAPALQTTSSWESVPRTSDRADQLTVLDQWNAAAGSNDSVQRHQVIQIVDLDTVLEDLSFAAEDCGRARFVLGDLN